MIADQGLSYTCTCTVYASADARLRAAAHMPAGNQQPTLGNATVADSQSQLIWWSWPCTTLNSTFYCRNVKIRTQHFNFHKPTFQNWWNEKFYPKNIGWPWNVPLNSWKIAQSTPFSILHLILELGTNLMSCSCRKKMILYYLKWQLRVFPSPWTLNEPWLIDPLLFPLLVDCTLLISNQNYNV